MKQSAKRAKTLILLMTLCYIPIIFARDVNDKVNVNVNSKPPIAVYVTGGHDAGVNRALTTRLLEAFVNSERYAAIERSGDFLAEIDREQARQRSGAVDDEQIRELGRQAGAHFVCVADITPALGSFQVSARIINVETAAVVAIGVSDSRLRTMDDLTAASNKIVAMLLGGSDPAAGRRARQRQATQLAQSEPKPERERKSWKFDIYITPRYVFPMTNGVPNWAFNAESGVVWGNGWFGGVDYGYGAAKGNETAGYGFNIGRTYDLPAQLQLSGGVFAGWWDERWEGEYWIVEGPLGFGYWQEEKRWKEGWAGPFVRLRWHHVEVSYRMIVGKSGASVDPDGSPGIINQLMLGLHFQTSKRQQIVRSAE
jgi:hypothetical protein